MQTIALATHPANKDASAVAVRDVHFGHSIATVFLVTKGYIPAIRGLTAPGYFSSEGDAIEWLELVAELADHHRAAINAFNARAAQ